RWPPDPSYKGRFLIDRPRRQAESEKSACADFVAGGPSGAVSTARASLPCEKPSPERPDPSPHSGSRIRPDRPDGVVGGQQRFFRASRVPAWPQPPPPHLAGVRDSILRALEITLPLSAPSTLILARRSAIAALTWHV